MNSRWSTHPVVMESVRKQLRGLELEAELNGEKGGKGGRGGKGDQGKSRHTVPRMAEICVLIMGRARRR
jgi:hypothetical protein